MGLGALDIRVDERNWHMCINAMWTLLECVCSEFELG
jgi:hypothetical protein